VVACARRSYSCVRRNFASLEDDFLLFPASGAGRLRPAQCRKLSVFCWLLAARSAVNPARGAVDLTG
ncbi:hypothetical protein A2U01_0104674, partial [Trifolium medium]|nr:hypothetical protein [Trifolium medium]